MLRIATYNAHNCIGRDGVYSPERIAMVLLALDAEVIALQEITLDAAGELLGYFKKTLGMHILDGTVLDRGIGRYGNILLSLHSVAEQRLHDLSVAERERRGVLDAVLDLGGQSLRVLATHLGLAWRERKQQIERLCMLLDETHQPTVLIGDFNVWRSGKELSPLKALGFKHIRVRSFPTWRTPLVPLDLILSRSPAVVYRCWRHETPLSRIASDHYPIVAEIQVTG